MSKLRVGIVGATGIAGQQFLTALMSHQLFQVTALAGSKRSAGKTYREALTGPSGQIGWWQPQPLPDHLAAMKVELGTDLDLSGLDLVFTAVESDAARELEPHYASHVPVVSTASAYRMDEDIPLLIPGINNEHCALIETQRKRRGFKGFIAPIPNCTTYGLASSLAPLHRRFTVKKVLMTSMQATSGAGRHGGVLALDMIDNLVPYIPGEEEKVGQETQKILGTLDSSRASIAPAEIQIGCTCIRVPVTDGHTEAVFLATEASASPAEALECLEDANLQWGTDLPSAPDKLFTVYTDPFMPQPRLLRDRDGGMTTHIGRMRADATLGGLKYVLLSHNTKAGAAKGAILVAELLHREGYL